MSGPDDGRADWGVAALDWRRFWASETTAEDYVIEPLIAAGRQTAIYSVAKAGKSLLALDVVAAAATGRSILGQPAKPPIRIVYIDLEMTEDDLRERLGDLGYGSDDDLSNIAYYQLPSLPPLDTDLGGDILTGIAEAHRADVVFIDTMARAVRGEENSADTYRNFYRHTGLRLKALRIALARLDHMGKDGNQGQRGSSAKDDDLDVVFKLVAADSTHLTLTRTRTRVPWIPAEISIVRQEEPRLRHVLSSDSWPAGTHEVAMQLDELGVPLDAQTMIAVRALKDSGNGKRKALVIAALKFRRTGS
jgi:RecA-family ATPase